MPRFGALEQFFPASKCFYYSTANEHDLGEQGRFWYS